MQTYLLSDDAVRRYALDLVDRLKALGEDFPTCWYSLGRSGDKMVRALFDVLPPDLMEKIQLIRVAYDRKTNEITFRDEEEKAIPVENGASAGNAGFLIDSAVHSGGSMIAVVDELYKSGITHIISYSLVVKHSSAFIPNYFGLVIAEHDRALFQLDKYPNNRLQRKSPFGTVRAVRASDVELEPNSIRTGVASIDKITFADLVYGARAQNTSAYVFEVKGRPVGFVQFAIDESRVLRIDAIANDEDYRGKGIGGALMRWAETYARSAKCHSIELWAITSRLDFYKGCKFKVLDGETWNLGKDEKYVKMQRRILYNIKTAALFEN